MNNNVSIMSWTRDHAIEYCIKVAELNINIYCRDPITVFNVYQHILFPNRQHSFYARLWNKTVFDSLTTMAYTRFEDPENFIVSVKYAIDKEEEPENLEQFITRINNIKLSFEQLKDTNIDFTIWCLNGIQNYVIKQLKKLYTKDISGPECLMRYVYPYASELKLPKEDFTWLIPSIKGIWVGLCLKSNKDVPNTCSFCKKQKTTAAFAVRSTQYTYNVFTTCNDCKEFKDYYDTCYLTVQAELVSLPITEENQLDLSCLEKK